MAISERADLSVLKTVQSRVVWLATSIIHHANKVRRDHRVLYGANAAQFLWEIRDGLEAPLRLMV
jgi:pyruvate/2-oxoglutarate dehydrogenase complex dihydrolipoamide acyltransferase (E2) component